MVYGINMSSPILPPAVMGRSLGTNHAVSTPIARREQRQGRLKHKRKMDRLFPRMALLAPTKAHCLARRHCLLSFPEPLATYNHGPRQSHLASLPGGQDHIRFLQSFLCGGHCPANLCILCSYLDFASSYVRYFTTYLLDNSCIPFRRFCISFRSRSSALAMSQELSWRPFLLFRSVVFGA